MERVEGSKEQSVSLEECKSMEFATWKWYDKLRSWRHHHIDHEASISLCGKDKKKHAWLQGNPNEFELVEDPFFNPTCCLAQSWVLS